MEIKLLLHFPFNQVIIQITILSITKELEHKLDYTKIMRVLKEMPHFTEELPCMFNELFEQKI
jgi:uncharacterized protein (UPF0212 family)